MGFGDTLLSPSGMIACGCPVLTSMPPGGHDDEGRCAISGRMSDCHRGGVIWSFPIEQSFRFDSSIVGVLGRAAASGAAQPFHLLERARPVSAQQARQCAVGEEPPAGLAARAVVRLVIRVGNPRDRGPASRARFSVTSVDRHAFVKGGHFLGEAFAGFAPAASARDGCLESD